MTTPSLLMSAPEKVVPKLVSMMARSAALTWLSPLRSPGLVAVVEVDSTADLVPRLPAASMAATW